MMCPPRAAWSQVTRQDRSGLLITAALLLAACASPDKCQSLNRLVSNTYGFKPSALDSTQLASRTQAMDAFWDSVRAGKDAYLPCLRKAIVAQVDDPFFQLDASALLVSLDSSRASKELQLSALEHVNLLDAALGAWVSAVAERGFDGFNTATAAARWLALPDSEARYFLPVHGGFEVGKRDGALFLYGSMPESLATPTLVALAASPETETRQIAFWLLAQQETEASRKALASLPLTGFPASVQRTIADYIRGVPGTTPRAGPPRISRAEFLHAFGALHTGDTQPFDSLVLRAPHGEQDAAKVLTAADLAEVRFARRYFIAGATPEAIAYYNDFTGIIEALMARSAH